jgi:hypothetical protein
LATLYKPKFISVGDFPKKFKAANMLDFKVLMKTVICSTLTSTDSASVFMTKLLLPAKITL